MPCSVGARHPLTATGRVVWRSRCGLADGEGSGGVPLGIELVSERRDDGNDAEEDRRGHDVTNRNWKSGHYRRNWDVVGQSRTHKKIDTQKEEREWRLMYYLMPKR